MKWLAVAGLLTALMVVGPATADSTRYLNRVQKHINTHRAEHGLTRLREGSCGDRYAQRWVQLLAASQTFRHSEILNLAERCNRRYVGEILFRGNATSLTTVELFLSSGKHHEVIDNPVYHRIGVGTAHDSLGRRYTAIVFLR